MRDIVAGVTGQTYELKTVNYAWTKIQLERNRYFTFVIVVSIYHVGGNVRKI